MGQSHRECQFDIVFRLISFNIDHESDNVCERGQSSLHTKYEYSRSKNAKKFIIPFPFYYGLWSPKIISFIRIRCECC